MEHKEMNWRRNEKGKMSKDGSEASRRAKMGRNEEESKNAARISACVYQRKCRLSACPAARLSDYTNAYAYGTYYSMHTIRYVGLFRAVLGTAELRVLVLSAPFRATRHR